MNTEECCRWACKSWLCPVQTLIATRGRKRPWPCSYEVKFHGEHLPLSSPRYSWPLTAGWFAKMIVEIPHYYMPIWFRLYTLENYAQHWQHEKREDRLIRVLSCPIESFVPKPQSLAFTYIVGWDFFPYRISSHISRTFKVSFWAENWL